MSPKIFLGSPKKAKQRQNVSESLIGHNIVRKEHFLQLLRPWFCQQIQSQTIGPPASSKHLWYQNAHVFACPSTIKVVEGIGRLKARPALLIRWSRDQDPGNTIDNDNNCTCVLPFNNHHGFWQTLSRRNIHC